MDFVRDQLSNGQTFRILTVIDKWSPQSELIDVSFQLKGPIVVKAFNGIAKKEDCPCPLPWIMLQN